MSESTPTTATPAGSSPAAAATPIPTGRPDVKQIVSQMTPEQRRQIAAGKFPQKPATPAIIPPVAATPAPAEVAPAPTETPTHAPAATEDQPEGNPAEPASGEKGTPNRFRFSDEKDQAVALYAKAHGISLIEAAQRLAPPPAAQAATASATPAAEAAPDPEVSAVEARISETQTRIEKLSADRKKAMDDLDTEKIAELSDQIAEAKADARILAYEKSGLIKSREQQAAQTAQEQVNASRDRALTEYPELAQGESVGRLALNAYIQQAKANPSRQALFQKPNWPEVMVQEFASKYGIKSKDAAGTAPATPATTPAATPSPMLKPAPKQAAATPAGAKLLTSANGQAPGAPKPMTAEEAKALIRSNPKLGRQVFQTLGQRK